MSSVTDELLDSNQEQETSQTARWYAVQVASGCEKRVKTNLEQRIQPNFKSADSTNTDGENP